MDGVVEIITGRERRRRWSTGEKLRILAETTEPGAVMRTVAARNGICESLLYTWRRQMREGTLREMETPAFVPVRVFKASMNAVVSERIGTNIVVHWFAGTARSDRNRTGRRTTGACWS